MIGLIVSLIVIGLIAGALARLLVPGRQDISIPMTILIGIIAAFIGTFIAGVVILLTGFDRADAIASLVVVALMLRNPLHPRRRRSG